MATVLVTAAGGGAANNLIRSLLARRPGLEVVGTNLDKWWLARSLAHRNHLVPRGDAGQEYLEALSEVVRAEGVDVVVPANDAEVGPIRSAAATLGAATLLPSPEALALCRDKHEFALRLEERGVPVAHSVALTGLDDVGRAFTEMPGRERLWCRARVGSASRAALPVRDAAEAEWWVRYWAEVRGVPADSFQVCDYLPGRDFACQCLFREGALVLAQAAERVEYLAGAWLPSGQSSTPRVARLVEEPAVYESALAAVRAVDKEPNGVYSVDLKEDAAGVPCVTEINAGRFFMICPLFEAGRHSQADLYLRLALGEEASVPEADRLGGGQHEDLWLVRELDGEPTVLTAAEIERRSGG